LTVQHPRLKVVSALAAPVSTVQFSTTTFVAERGCRGEKSWS
jgi:hypothetical protein